jgi:hypothetical protein
MPAKELTPNDLLKLSSNASKALNKGLTKNKDFDGKPRGLPAGISGTAKISSIKLRANEKPTETWMTFNVTATVVTPEEYKGRLIYPQFMYGLKQLEDAKVDEYGLTQAEKTVRGLISFLQGVGISQTQIDKVKAAKEKAFHVAFKSIEAGTGIEFNFSTQNQKKKKPDDPDRVECRVKGPVAVDTTAPFTTNDAEESQDAAPGDAPAVGETWSYQDKNYTVTGVDLEAMTVDLDDGEGETHEGLSWFNGDDAQIEFVSAAE